MSVLVKMEISEMEHIGKLAENLESNGYYLKCIVNKGRMFCNAGRETSAPAFL